MSSEGIQIPIVAEDQFSDTFNAAQSSLSEFSNQIAGVSEAESGLGTSTEEMTTSMNQMSESTQGMQESVASSNGTFSDSASQIGQVSATMAMGVGAAFSLGDAFMKQQDANLRLQNAQDNLTKSQNAYNLAVEKYGPNSTQAQNALLALTNAHNNLTAAQNKAQMAGEQVNMSLLQTATTVPMLISQLPEMIGFITGYGAATDALTLSEIAQTAATGIASGAMALFDAVMDANPIMLVVIGIAGLVAGLAYLTDGFKNFGPLEKDFNVAWKDLQIVFNDVVSFIKSDVYPVLDELYKTYIQPIITGINDISSIGKSISGGLGSLGKDIGIPGLATGGIVTRPTLAMIGESGPEAVLPLPQISSPTSTSNTSSVRNATITINNNNQISSDVDADALIQKMGGQIAEQIDRGS